MVSTPSTDDLVEECVVPAAIVSGEPVSIFVSFKFNDSVPYPLTTLTNTLQFTTKEIDIHTGEPEEEGYEDEYKIDDLDVSAGDFISPAYESNFDGLFDSLEHEASEVYVLSLLDSFRSTCSRVAELLQMQPLEGTENPTDKPVHVMKLSGKLVNGEKVLALVKMAHSKDGEGITIKVIARGESDSSVELVVGGIA